MLRDAIPERVSAFSDAVFAVLITVLVLELRPPAQPSFAALFAEWLTLLSYAVSYVFIAIVWVNHHYLMRHAERAAGKLLWVNFAHLFAISLLPLATSWMATSRLSGQPVVFYASIFFLVNLTYILLILELIAERDTRTPMLSRAVVTLVAFGGAAIMALWLPFGGLAICIACLALYLRPEPRPAN